MRKSIYILVAIFMTATMVLTSCGPAATTVAPATNVPVSAPPTAVPPTVVPTPAAADVAKALPRNETLYFNGQQWGSVVCWNPYSSSCNNAMAIAQQDSARVIMFETPYLYDMLDGKQLSSAGRWSLGMERCRTRCHLQAQEGCPLERWHPGDRR